MYFSFFLFFNNPGTGSSLSGKKFHHSTIHKILTHQHYTGTYYSYRTYNKKTGANSHTILKRDSSEWIQMHCPRIIPQDTWEAVQNKLDEKETTWIQNNLTLGDKSRESVHRWKETTRYLPGYLSDKTKAKIKKIDKEADEIIKEGKIEDVVFYFDKLSAGEKKECIEKLKTLI